MPVCPNAGLAVALFLGLVSIRTVKAIVTTARPVASSWEILLASSWEKLFLQHTTLCTGECTVALCPRLKYSSI